MADSLGVTIFVPVVLLAFSGSLAHPVRLVRGQAFAWTILLLLFIVTAAIFSQSSNPILFLYFPPLILVIFSLGSEGAIIASVITAVVGSAATAHGSGPAWIAHGVHLDQRVLVLQLFLWSTVVTALPIGALLDERRDAEAHASENQAIYKTLINHSKDMIVLARLDGSYRFVSPAVEKVTGYTQQEYGSLPSLEWVHPEDRDLARAVLVSLADSKADQTVRYRAMHKNGNFSWFEAYLRGYVDTEDGPITGYVATVQDITALKQMEDTWFAEKHALANENAQLATLAEYDELTGIPNRRAFNRALTLEVTRQNRSADFLSLLMVDVDHFKKYNDCYGHHAGDVCLHDVAAVLKGAASRPNDLAARIGGEEFAILLPQTDHAVP